MAAPPSQPSGSGSKASSDSKPSFGIDFRFVLVGLIAVGYLVYRSLSPTPNQVAPAANQLGTVTDGVGAVDGDSFGPAETLPDHQQCDEAGNCKEVWIFDDVEQAPA